MKGEYLTLETTKHIAKLERENKELYELLEKKLSQTDVMLVENRIINKKNKEINELKNKLKEKEKNE